MEWNAAGRITRLLEQDNGWQVLAEGRAGNILPTFDDRPLLSRDGWGRELYTLDKPEEVRERGGISLRENGPLRCPVALSWCYNPSVIRREIRFHAGSRRIDFVTEVDWQETRKLLKADFPVDVRATEATYDKQLGNVRRPTRWNTRRDYGRFEVRARGSFTALLPEKQASTPQ